MSPVLCLQRIVILVHLYAERNHIPGNAEVSSFDLLEKFLLVFIIEWKLTIEHGVEQYSHCPHITSLSIIRVP